MKISLVLSLILLLLLLLPHCARAAEPAHPAVVHRLIDTVSAHMSKEEYDSFVEFHDWTRAELLENGDYTAEDLDVHHPVWKFPDWTAWGEDMGDVYLVLLRTSSGALSLSYFEGYSVEAMGACLGGIARLKPSPQPVRGFANLGVYDFLALDKIFPRLLPKVQEHYRRGQEPPNQGNAPAPAKPGATE